MSEHTKYTRICQFLHQFLDQEVTKIGFKNVVLGLSGGIDSAVVAVLCQQVFGDRLLTIMMPSEVSAKSSIDDAKELCKTFDINHQIIPITPFVQAFTKSLTKDISSHRIGNFCARIRMNILFDASLANNALVMGTSNKTELLLGYGTIYGDLASAINPIGDLYKTQIFALAHHLQINENIINKPPSADLWQGQSDEAEIGYSYKDIDTLLIAMIDNRIPKEKLYQIFDNPMVDDLHKRIFTNQFKRKMPIIPKLSNRSITHDFLYPRDIYH